jgi:hypothetical protein
MAADADDVDHGRHSRGRKNNRKKERKKARKKARGENRRGRIESFTRSLCAVAPES